MRAIRISKRSKILLDLLEQARHENIVLRSDDGTEFILAEIDDFDREIEFTRQNTELMQYLEGRAKQQETVSLKEARTQLGL